MTYDRSKYQTDNPYDGKARRKELRHNLTPAEATLWKLLRGKQMNGSRWRRQYGVGPYILDFYCHELRLGIELDGDGHYSPDGLEHDRQRSDYLYREHGIRILRYENEDVFRNMSVVVRQIQTAVSQRRAELSQTEFEEKKEPATKNCPASQGGCREAAGGSHAHEENAHEGNNHEGNNHEENAHEGNKHES